MITIKYKSIFLFVLLLIINACTEESIVTLDTKTAVVEAYLFAGQPADSIRIIQSYSYARENTDLITLNELAVQISDGQQRYDLDYSTEGIYQNPDFIPQSGATYVLTFDHNGETIRSETFVPQKQTISISKTSVKLEKITDFGEFIDSGFGGDQDAIEVEWDNSEGDYYYVVIENMEDHPEFVNDLLAEFQANGNARRFFQITEPEISNFYAIIALRDLTQFGTYRIIVYRVNPEYAALYETAGTSSISIATPPSNIENGLGIFTGVSSDTVYLEVIKI